MSDMPVVRDAMHAPVRTVHQDAPLLSAAALLATHPWSGAPVVDDAGAVVGVLSERDALLALAAAAFHGDPGVGCVRDAMSAPAHTTTPDTDLFSLIPALTRGPHRRLVVVDDNRRPVGLLTRKDLLKAVYAEVNQRVHIPTYDAWARARGIHNPL